jgi:hypothetical protein
MIAFAPRLMGIHAFRRLGLIAVDRLHGRIQIENELGGQTRPNHFEVHLPEFPSYIRIRFSQPIQFLVQKRVVWTASTEKPLKEGVLLLSTKVKQTLTAQYPTDDEV